MLSCVNTLRAALSPTRKEAAPTSPLLSQVGKVSFVGETTITKAANWAKTRQMRYRDSVLGLRQVEILGRPLSRYSKYQVNSLSISAKLKELLTLLIDDTPSVQDYRTHIYPKVVKELRELSEKNILQKASLENQLIKALCYLHFTLDIKSSEIGFSYVKNLFANGFSDELLDPSILDKRLSAVFKRRSIGTEITDLKRRLSANVGFLSWDPSLYSIRSSFSKMEVEGRDVHFLRMACPVIGSTGKPRIDPLFKAYLSSLKSTECHLYVNNLSHDTKSDHRRKKIFRAQVGFEYKRSEALRELSLDPDYSNRFKLITLPHDSDFYRQKKTPKRMKSSDFIDEFVKNVEGNLQGFYFPNTINKKVLGIKVRKILNDILKKEFKGKESLTQEDRKKIIKIAYSDITKAFITRLKATHCNITCKDGVDRAMGSLANLQVRLNPKTTVDEIVYTLVIASTLNHARAPKASRVRQSLASINTLIESAKV